jgi:hypothetical protein
MMPELSKELTDSQWKIVLQSKTIENSSDINRLNKIVLDGNGELPLREQVRNNTKFIEEFRYWIKFIFGAVILQSLGLITAGIYMWIRLAPILEKLSNAP